MPTKAAEPASEPAAESGWTAAAHHQRLDALLHRHGRAPRNVNDVEAERMTLGQRVADAVTGAMGSWRFIIIQSGLLLVWLILNVAAFVGRWDPYPFILLNLALSFQAAYAAPIIMMSQNRQAAKDRLVAEEDYDVNLRAQLEIAAVHARFDDLTQRQWAALIELQERQLAMLERIDAAARRLDGASR